MAVRRWPLDAASPRLRYDRRGVGARRRRGLDDAAERAPEDGDHCSDDRPPRAYARAKGAGARAARLAARRRAGVGAAAAGLRVCGEACGGEIVGGEAAARWATEAATVQCFVARFRPPAAAGGGAADGAADTDTEEEARAPSLAFANERRCSSRAARSTHSTRSSAPPARAPCAPSTFGRVWSSPTAAGLSGGSGGSGGGEDGWCELRLGNGDAAVRLRVCGPCARCAPWWRSTPARAPATAPPARPRDATRRRRARPVRRLLRAVGARRRRPRSWWARGATRSPSNKFCISHRISRAVRVGHSAEELALLRKGVQLSMPELWTDRGAVPPTSSTTFAEGLPPSSRISCSSARCTMGGFSLASPARAPRRVRARVLLAAGAPIEVRDSRGETALMTAARTGAPGAPGVLGRRRDVVNGVGDSPLHAAARGCAAHAAPRRGRRPERAQTRRRRPRTSRRAPRCAPSRRPPPPAVSSGGAPRRQHTPSPRRRRRPSAAPRDANVTPTPSALGADARGGAPDRQRGAEHRPDRREPLRPSPGPKARRRRLAAGCRRWSAAQDIKP